VLLRASGHIYKVFDEAAYWVELICMLQSIEVISAEWDNTTRTEKSNFIRELEFNQLEVCICKREQLWGNKTENLSARLATAKVSDIVLLMATLGTHWKAIRFINRMWDLRAEGNGLWLDTMMFQDFYRPGLI
jgi:hypothetical protein